MGKLLGLMGRIVKGCVREVRLAQVSCILMYVYVAPPTPVGAWSMALGLRQHFEYYYASRKLTNDELIRNVGADFSELIMSYIGIRYSFS